ncbi:hypothetical protein [Halorhabdus rudnickae]|nr:hypothetical protein [Halorhabdus rudnickae]
MIGLGATDRLVESNCGNHHRRPRESTYLVGELTTANGLMPAIEQRYG